MLFALLAILFFSSTVTSFRLDNDAPNRDPVKLNDLCQSSNWMFKSINVNSFYSAKFNHTFEAVSRLAFEEEEEFIEFFPENKTAAKKVWEIKDQHNEIISQIYSENIFTPEKKGSLVYYPVQLAKLKEEMEKFRSDVNEEKVSEFDELLKTFDRAQDFIKTLRAFQDNVVHPDAMKLNQFKSFIGSLNIDEKTQIMALKNDPIIKMYKRQIVEIERFILNRASKNFYDFRSTGTIEFSINLPFNNKKYSQTPCVRGEMMPPFFSRKIQV